MYPVSEAFLRAGQENTRRYYWKGRITTKGGAVYPFGKGCLHFMKNMPAQGVKRSDFVF